MSKRPLEPAASISNVLDTAEIASFERFISVKCNNKYAFQETCLLFAKHPTCKTKWLLKLWVQSQTNVSAMCQLAIHDDQVSGCDDSFSCKLLLEGVQNFMCPRSAVTDLTISNEFVSITTKHQQISVNRLLEATPTDRLIPNELEDNKRFNVRFECPFSFVDTVWAAISSKKKQGTTHIMVNISCDSNKRTSLLFTAMSDDVQHTKVHFDKSPNADSSLHPGTSHSFSMAVPSFEKLVDLCRIKKSSKGLCLPFTGYLSNDSKLVKIQCTDPGTDRDSIPIALSLPFLT